MGWGWIWVRVGLRVEVGVGVGVGFEFDLGEVWAGLGLAWVEIDQRRLKTDGFSTVKVPRGRVLCITRLLASIQIMAILHRASHVFIASPAWSWTRRGSRTRPWSYMLR